LKPTRALPAWTRSVASRAEAWVETGDRLCVARPNTSPPARRRGLKPELLGEAHQHEVASRAEAWIEHQPGSARHRHADTPKTRASLKAVSGVTPLLPRRTSFSRGKEIPRRIAKADWEIPSATRNSSRSISPGWVGGRPPAHQTISLAVLLGGNRRFPWSSGCASPTSSRLHRHNHSPSGNRDGPVR
jgi:hypothetical protein